MFPNPFSPPPPPPAPRSSPGLTPQEKGRIILMAVAMLVVLGMMGAMVVYSQGTLPGDTERDPQDMPADPRPGGDGTAKPLEIVPLFPEEEGAEVEGILRADLAKWTDVVQGVAAVDPEPYALLLDRVSGNARVMNLQEAAFDGKAEPAALLAAPAASMGKLVLVSGELLSLEREPYEIPSGLVREVRRGMVRDGGGRLWTFSWPVGNPLEPDPVAPGGGWVRLQGIFYKSWPARAPGAEAEVPTPHLVLQRRPRLDFPRVEIRDLDASWFDQVRDETPADMVIRDEDPLFYLLNLARNIGPDGWEGWAKAKQARDPGLRIWPPEDVTGRYKELLDRPEIYRFRPVRYVGYLARPSVIKEVRPNPGNVEQLWVGFLVDQDGAPALWVSTPFSLLDRAFKPDARVAGDGIFLKRVAYPPAGGGPMKRAAVVVATRVVAAPMGTDNVGRSVMLVLAGFMLLLGFGLWRSIRQGRIEAESAEKRRVERLARRREPVKGPVDAPPPAEGGA